MSAGVSSDHHHHRHRHHHHHHLMDKENLFDFPTDFPYDFASHYSTDDEQLTQLTHRFSQSPFLQQPLFNQGKRVLGSTHSPAAPPPSSLKSEDEDAWNMVHAAAGQIARMKLTMGISNGAGGFVANNNNSVVIGVPHGFDGVALLRQQQLCWIRGVSAWSSPEVQNQCLRHRLFRSKHGVHGSRGGGDSGYTAAKREYAGTGVFLPRGYCDNPPESRKRQGGMTQSFTKSFIPITTPPELHAHINGGFVSHNELLMAQRKAMMLASQPLQQSPQRLRTNIHGLVTETAVNNPAVLLPQEWTY